MSNDLNRVGPTPWATRLFPRVSTRSAVGTLFFLNGVLLASWASEIPSIRNTLQLPVGLLAVALFGLPLGSVAVLPLITVGLRILGARGVGGRRGPAGGPDAGAGDPDTGSARPL